MKTLLLPGCLLLAATVHAASPPADTMEPAVTTSPAAAPPDAQAPQGRGNPRRLELQVDPATPSAPAATAPASAPGTAQPQARGSADRIDLDATAPRAGPRGADRIQLEATQITGNAELPRVMYVVPWKRPELGDLNGRPAKSLLDEVLAPVDRDVFRRQNRYYDALQPDAARAAPAGEK
jgi:hypothetical protein